MHGLCILFSYFEFSTHSSLQSIYACSSVSNLNTRTATLTLHLHSRHSHVSNHFGVVPKTVLCSPVRHNLLVNLRHSESQCGTLCDRHPHLLGACGARKALLDHHYGWLELSLLEKFPFTPKVYMRQMNIYIQVGAMIVVNPSRHGSRVLNLRQLRLENTCKGLFAQDLKKKRFRRLKALLLSSQHRLHAQRRICARIYQPLQEMKWVKPARISIATPTSGQEFSLG